MGQLIAQLPDNLVAGQSNIAQKGLVGIDNPAAVDFDDRNGIRYAVNDGLDEILLLANGILLFL